MRIGIYDPYLNTLSGGEKYMLTAASCLAKSHKVSVFWDDHTVLDKAEKKLNINLSKVNIEPNIFSANQPLLAKLSETAKYDVIIVLSDGSIPFTLAKKTIIHFQHPVEWVNPNIKTKIKLKKISKVICNSFFTKKYIDKKFSINSYVLYPPCLNLHEEVNSSAYDPQKHKKNIITTVGRYSPAPDGEDTKKLGVLINVFKKMVDDGLQNWEFHVALSFLSEYENYINQIEKQTKNYPIKIIKNSNFSELKKLYAKTRIYWHAAGYNEDIEKNPERAEHFGITTVEAMANYIVPIVFAKGGQLEIVDDNINGLYWHTKNELMQKTKKIMIDNNLRIRMGKLAHEKSKYFTTESFCRKLRDLISD